MKRLIARGAGILLLAAALSVGAQEAQQEVQKLADQWSDAYNGHNRAALSKLYTADARLMMHGSPTIAGRGDIEAFWSDDFTSGNPITVLTVTHSLKGADMILVHGNYQVIDRDKGTVLGRGRFAHIWTKDSNDLWLLDRDLWNEPFEPYR